MDRKDVLTVVVAGLGLLGTLGGAGLGNWLALRKDKLLRRDELDRQARYLAIRVICMLDPFISACCDVVRDGGSDDAEGLTHPDVTEPSIFLPNDVDWKSIKPELLYRILSFPNEITIANQSISFVSDMVASAPDYEEFFEERTIQYGRLGLTAMELADELRDAFGVLKREYGDRHPRTILQDAVRDAEKQRSESAARQAELIDATFNSVTETEALLSGADRAGRHAASKSE